MIGHSTPTLPRASSAYHPRMYAYPSGAAVRSSAIRLRYERATETAYAPSVAPRGAIYAALFMIVGVIFARAWRELHVASTWVLCLTHDTAVRDTDSGYVRDSQCIRIAKCIGRSARNTRQTGARAVRRRARDGAGGRNEAQLARLRVRTVDLKSSQMTGA